MTLEELCKILNRSKSTLMTNFNRTQATFAKKGILIEKEGEGEKANYTIKIINKEKQI